MAVAHDLDVERAVCRIWGDVLGTRVERDDDFFSLGGQSATAARVAFRIRCELGIDVGATAVFEAPTPARLARALALCDRANGPVAASGAAAATRRSPLTASQERIWHIEQLIPDAPGLKTRARMRLTGDLDVAALTLALAALVRRHAALRTRYAVDGGRPVQVVGEDVAFDLTEVELPCAEEEEPRVADRFANEFLRRPFDLASDPLLRVALARFGPGRHLLLVVSHHIAFDGWSRDVFLRDLVTAYRAYARGDEPEFAAQPVEFADYAEWERAHFTGDVLAEHLAFWRRELAPPLHPLALRPQRGGSTRRTFRSGDRDCSVDADVASGVASLAGAEGATLFMTLLAAFDALLHVRTGTPEIAVATLVANRDWPDTHELVGLFANLVVLRTRVSGKDSFRELVRRVRDVALRAYAHQGLPFETLLTELEREGAVDRRALLQVGFALQVASSPSHDLGGGVELELLRELSQGEGDEINPSTFDLTLEFVESRDGLVGRLEYDRDTFDESAVADLATDLRRLLARAFEQPDTTIATLLDAAR